MFLQKLKQFLQPDKRNVYLVLLFLVFLIIAMVNFPAGKWFLGWDNLVPEFNFTDNFLRGIYSTWQDNEGLGLMAGHGFASTVVHTLYILFLSIIVPIKYTRIIFILLTLVLGAIGTFLLTEKVLHKKNAVTYYCALIAGIFYMVNIGTIQNFFAPLESFVVHFAALPWLLFSLFQLIEEFNKRNIITFFIINLLSVPMGFIPPLFIVYVVFVLITILTYLLQKRSLKALKHSIIILLIIGIVNSFWFLPVAYYTFTNSNTYLNAYNNLNSTDDFIYQNKRYGDIKNVALIKGFTFEAIDIDKQGTVFPILGAWTVHFDKSYILALGYLYFLIGLIAIFYLGINKRKSIYVSLIPIYILSFTLLATNIPPFSYVSEILRNDIPVFKQAFRIAFTKFSISLSLLYSVFLGIGVYAVIKYLNLKRITSLLLSFALLISIFIYSLPVFEGHLFYKRLQVDLPNAYLELFSYFKDKPKGKILNLHQGWNWGWSVYTWDYSGSGFLWYGLPQAIMDRAFDVWSPYNENYYWELVYALYSEKFDQFDSIVDKYNINWILFDDSIIPYPNVQSFRYSDKIKNHLNSNPKYSLVNQWNINNTNLYLYEIVKTKTINQVEIINNPKNVPSYNWNNYDKAYINNGPYYTDTNKPYDIFYPFRSLFTGRKGQEKEFNIINRPDGFIFLNQFSNIENGSILSIPQLFLEELEDLDKLPKLFINSQEINVLSSNNISVNNNDQIAILVPKIPQFYNYQSQEDDNFKTHQPTDCSVKTKGFYSQTWESENNLEFLRFRSKDARTCYDILLPELPQILSYMVTVTARNLEGRPLRFAVINRDSQKADLEVTLDSSKEMKTNYFVIPPMKRDGFGYNLHFENTSLTNDPTVNDVMEISVYPIPYYFLTDIFASKLIADQTVINEPELKVNYYNPTYYGISLTNSSENSYLTLNQSYDKGWSAYQVNGLLSRLLPFILAKKIDNHVLVNNWANGWQLEDNSNNIVLFYTPQLLQYLGFIILLFGTVIILKSKKFDN